MDKPVRSASCARSEEVRKLEPTNTTLTLRHEGGSKFAIRSPHSLEARRPESSRSVKFNGTLECCIEIAIEAEILRKLVSNHGHIQKMTRQFQLSMKNRAEICQLRSAGPPPSNRNRSE